MKARKPTPPNPPTLLIACATRNGKTRAMRCVKALAKAKGTAPLWVFDAGSTEYKHADLLKWGADKVVSIKSKDWTRVAKKRLKEFLARKTGPDLLYLTDARVLHPARAIKSMLAAYESSALPVAEYADPAHATPGERSAIKGRVQRSRAAGYSLLINRKHAERILEHMADHPKFTGEWYELASTALGLFDTAQRSRVKVLK